MMLLACLYASEHLSIPAYMRVASAKSHISKLWFLYILHMIWDCISITYFALRPKALRLPVSYAYIRANLPAFSCSLMVRTRRR